MSESSSFGYAQSSRPKSNMESLVDEISRASVAVSTHASPGGGAGHENCFYGSPVVEQASAFRVRTQVLKYTQVFADHPRTKAEFLARLNQLASFIEDLVVTDKIIWTVDGRDYSETWGPHMRAPVIAAAEAMKGQLLAIVYRRQSSLSLPEDTF